MFEVAWFSTKLLLKGKLLRNYDYFFRQITIAITLGLLILVVIEKLSANTLLTIILSSLIIGMAMPFLLKDVKLQ
ncbi:MAG: hypothetical protein QNJ18_13200 [Xenococcaceae cyanobacterium MO_167.B52]|nr:hypothetical protein [Xenococcaceae cyanobacterium MO_167.B52]